MILPSLFVFMCFFKNHISEESTSSGVSGKHLLLYHCWSPEVLLSKPDQIACYNTVLVFLKKYSLSYSEDKISFLIIYSFREILQEQALVYMWQSFLKYIVLPLCKRATIPLEMAAEAVTDAQQGGHHFSSFSKISKCFISFGLGLWALMKQLCASELKPEGIILVSSSNTRFVN